MKLLRFLWKQCALVIVLLVLQIVLLWTLYIEWEQQLYLLAIELFVLLCYLLVVYGREKRSYARMQRMDAAAYIKQESRDRQQQELQRMMREQQRELSEYKVRYQEEKNARERYFQIWIHQIKTPLFAMKMLLEHIHDEARKKQMRQELFKLERYTQMALNYQKLDDDHIIERCLLHELVQEALRTYSILFIEKGLQLDFTYEEAYIYTDRKWFIFVLEQLLDNAVKYTDKGGIHIRCAADGVMIQDEGCGIRREDIPLILRPGYTGATGRRSRQASGMGLFFVKEICARLHVKLQITSAPNAGCCVMLTPVQEPFYDK